MSVVSVEAVVFCMIDVVVDIFLGVVIKVVVVGCGAE